jgi:hypothetical protein
MGTWLLIAILAGSLLSIFIVGIAVDRRLGHRYPDRGDRLQEYFRS